MKTPAGKRFASKLAAAFKRVESAAMDGVGASADIMAGEVRGLAPRRTGDTAASIEPTPAERSRDIFTTSVVIAHPGIGSKEYGDRDQAAEPFIRPGFDASKGQALAAVLGPIKRAIEKAGR